MSDRHKKIISEYHSDTKFYFNPETEEEIRLKENVEIPEGFIPGRSKTLGIKNGRFSTKISKNFKDGNVNLINKDHLQPLWCGTNTSTYAFIYKNNVTFSSKVIPLFHKEISFDVMRCLKKVYVKNRTLKDISIRHDKLSKENLAFFSKFKKYEEIGLEIISIENFFSMNRDKENLNWIG